MKTSSHKATNNVFQSSTPESRGKVCCRTEGHLTGHELIQPFPPVSVMYRRVYGHWRRQDRAPNSLLPLTKFYVVQRSTVAFV